MKIIYLVQLTVNQNVHRVQDVLHLASSSPLDIAQNLAAAHTHTETDIQKLNAIY